VANRSALKLNDIVVSKVEDGHHLLIVTAVPARVPNDDAHITISYWLPGAGAAQQGAVAAQGDEHVERLPGLEAAGLGIGPEGQQLCFTVQRDPQLWRRLRHGGKEGREVTVAGVPDDPDVHRGERDSSAASARTRLAIPDPVNPTSSSCCARGACS